MMRYDFHSFNTTPYLDERAIRHFGPAKSSPSMSDRLFCFDLRGRKIIQNTCAQRVPYNSALREIMNIDRARENRQWLSSWSGIHVGPTPLWKLPARARRLRVAEVWIKDESKRSLLGSFKVLGAPIALVRLILRCRFKQKYMARDLFAGRHAEDLEGFVVISATDGNHGAALAAAAQSIGCRCVIVLHKNVSREREQCIAALGAKIMRVDGNYDDSVEESARLAARHGWQVVSDTSYEGYEEIPRDVMQGYAIIADEMVEQSDVGGNGPTPFTHIFLQGGVGGLAASIISYFSERDGGQRPSFIIVEPEQADCLYQSAIRRHASKAEGSVDSIMAGLACGQASPLAWRFLEAGADFFVLIGDEKVPKTMRTLAEGEAGDIPIVSGESGAAGLAALEQVAASDELRRLTGLSHASKIALINTEGDTAPLLYEDLVECSGKSVLVRQAAWLKRFSASCGRLSSSLSQ